VTSGRDEFALIDALRARFEGIGSTLGPDDLGIGDDAALVGLGGSGQVALATDLIVEGVHVDLAISTPEDAGWK
jgi:thiamine monophosphate kinase